MIEQGSHPLENRNITPFRTPIFVNAAPQLDVMLEKIEEEKEMIKKLIDQSIEQSIGGDDAKDSMEMESLKLQEEEKNKVMNHQAVPMIPLVNEQVQDQTPQ